jgi:IS30 family transposase
VDEEVELTLKQKNMVELTLGNFLVPEVVMPKLSEKKNKHLTLEDRIEIQDCLKHGMTFKAIAARVGKDQTTISKEIKKHIQIRPASSVDASDGEPALCPNLLKAPFICNGCNRKARYCGYRKQFYSAVSAHSEYETLLTESREGIPLNKEEFYKIDKIVSSGIKQGQHLYHIMQTNNLGVSKSTVYRHLNRGYLSVKSLDFPRVVKFKQRKRRRPDYVPKGVKIGRAYADFLTYIADNDISSWVEMDTVIGRIGGKVILTLDFTFCNFMVGILLDDKTALEAAEKIQSIKLEFYENGVNFNDVFPLLLTDNGGEFSNIFAFENNTITGERETPLFFCDPYQSSQKPKVEKNHTLFRDIVPKGTSFDRFTQETVNIIFSHVNGAKRKSLNGKSPYEMFTFVFGIEIAKILGISNVPPQDVIQSPALIKKNNS